MKNSYSLVLLLVLLVLTLGACGGNSEDNTVEIPEIELPGANKPPIAYSESINLSSEQTIEINLTAEDDENDSLTFVIVSQPAHGSLSQDNSKVIYTPALNYVGSDHFTFKVNDGINDSNISTIDLTIGSAQSESFTALAQQVYLELNTHLPIKLTSNAKFNLPVEYKISKAPQHGKLLGSIPNLDYVLNDLTFTGEDSFSFKANDGSGWSEEAKVDISIRKNLVTSAHAGGSVDELYLHVPNHLIYDEIGPNQFSLNVSKTDVDKRDESISRVQVNRNLLTVDLADKSLTPPYSLAIKWIPDAQDTNDTILQSSAIAIHETLGQLNTEILGGLNFNHPSQVTTSACNQATIIVESNKVTTYLNGVASSIDVDNANELTNAISFGNYQGKVWDLRVYQKALNQEEVTSIAKDCSDVTPTPFANAPLYRCGIYICLWYSNHNEFTEIELARYLKHQDYFYEHNVFAIGMHPHGRIGEYFSLGRPGWDLLSKERDMLLDHMWGAQAKSAAPLYEHYHMHEDFHQYQGVLSNFTGIGFSSFLYESTAEWSILDYIPEARTFNILGEYIYDSHLPMWMVADHDQSQYKTIRIDGKKQGGHPYGAYVFISYLAREVLSNKFVGDMFNTGDTSRVYHPVKSMYRMLAEVGVDMRDMFVEFAARTVTYDYKTGLTQAYRDNEQVTLQFIHSEINPDITEDSKYITIFDDAGTGAEWQSPPLDKRPGSWAYNLYKLSQAQGTYHLAVDPSANNPAHSEFRAMAVLYDEKTDTRKYYALPTDKLTEGIEVTAQGEDIMLVVATTPSQRFEGVEQYNYQFKMQKTTSKSVYLMAGQSNMEGHVDSSLFDDLLEELAKVSSDDLQVRLEKRINDWYQYADDGYAKYATSESVATYQAQELIRLFNQGVVGNSLKQPLANVLCSINGSNLVQLKDNCGFPFGPELTFGHYLSEKSDSSTSLIKIAYGGTDLETDWLSPSAVEGNKQVGELYEILAAKIDSLQTKPESINPDCIELSCQWSAFIWFQGEADSFIHSAANNYEKNLKSLITDVRHKVGRANLPVIIVEIGYWAKTLDYGDKVAAAQQKIADEDPNIILVNTDDLSRFFHYDPAGQMIIGERIGIALNNLLQK